MIELTPEQQQFVESQVSAGEFKNPTEVIQAGIDLLRQSAAERDHQDSDYKDTVAEIQKAVPDIKAGRGRTIEEADAAMREKLGFGKNA